MNAPYLIIATLPFAGLLLYLAGFRRSLALVDGDQRKLPSRPSHYGLFVSLCGLLPVLFLLVLWVTFEPLVIRSLLLNDQTLADLGGNASLIFTEITNVATGIFPPRNEVMAAAAQHLSNLNSRANYLLFFLSGSLLIAAYGVSRHRITPSFHARPVVERVVRVMLILSSLVAVLTTAGILLSLIFESVRFFELVSPLEFFFGDRWNPQIAMRSDQAASSGAFGAIPLFAGTFLISAIAIAVAAPVGLMSAIYLSEYAGSKTRAFAKPALEILAGIPTVVYGSLLPLLSLRL